MIMKENPDDEDKFLTDYSACNTCESKDENSGKKEYIVQPLAIKDLVKPLKVQERDFKNWFTFETAYDPEIYKLPNGEEIGYRWNGEVDATPIVLLIHGQLVCSQNMESILDVLEDDAYLIAPCLRGFGYSSYNSDISSLKDFAEDLKSFMES